MAQKTVTSPTPREIRHQISDTGTSRATNGRRHPAETGVDVPPGAATGPALTPGHAAAGEAGPDHAQDRNALIGQHLRLARSIAARYTGRGVDYEDLHQAASLALVIAAGHFDPHRGTPFAPYAIISMHGALKRYLRDHAWAVRPPRAIHDLFHLVAHATTELTHTLGATPTTSDIAAHLNIHPDQVHEARRAASSYTTTSLDALTDQHSGNTPPQLSAGHDTNPTHALDVSIALDRVISALPPLDQHLVRLRFKDDLTQQQIGDRLGISQMQVSRRLTSLTTRLRTHLTDAA